MHRPSLFRRIYVMILHNMRSERLSAVKRCHGQSLSGLPKNV